MSPKHAAERTFDNEQARDHHIRLAILAHIRRDDALINEREEALRQTCTSQEFGRYLMELATTLSGYGTLFETEALLVLSRTDNEYFVSPIGVAECRTAMARLFAARKEPVRALRLYIEAIVALIDVPSNRRATILKAEILRELASLKAAL